MPPHLHPRSRLTTSLFATTLLASFAVVGLPHILPCPAGPHRTAYTDGDLTEDNSTKRKRRRRRKPLGNTLDSQGAIVGHDGGRLIEGFEVTDDDVGRLDRRRECPVPKPKGIIGEVLAFAGRVSSKENESDRVKRG